MLQLNLQVALCAVMVLSSISAAICIVRRYEGGNTGGVGSNRPAGVVYAHEAWRPCLRSVDPKWLLTYRVICFMLFSTLAGTAIHRNPILLFYYTWWTFILVTTYFGLAAALSVYRSKPESDVYLSLEGVENRATAGFWGYILQILFQTTAGAVVLTDFVFWVVICSYLIHAGHCMNFWNIVAHSINLLFLLGDAALNMLPVLQNIILHSFYGCLRAVSVDHACIHTNGLVAIPVPGPVLWQSIVVVFARRFCTGPVLCTLHPRNQTQESCMVQVVSGFVYTSGSRSFASGS